MAFRFTDQHAMSLVASHLYPGEQVLFRSRGVEKPWYSRLFWELGSFMWKYWLVVATNQRIVFVQHKGLLGGYAAKRTEDVRVERARARVPRLGHLQQDPPREVAGEAAVARRHHSARMDEGKLRRGEGRDDDVGAEPHLAPAGASVQRAAGGRVTTDHSSSEPLLSELRRPARSRTL